ncbi:MAG TPA: rod shape-determining protein MreD, partial [Phycisphaerae bacterium]|nr:rod shape-determining protein MreD [Phycisphaerae bacterium]
SGMRFLLRSAGRRVDENGGPMKWAAFLILAVITLIGQTTIAQVIAIHSIRPNWMLVLAVHYALWGPWPEAAIGAWFLGLAVDLASLPVGGRMVYAFSFGAAAWIIIRIRTVFWREHALTQLLITFVFALAIELLVDVYRHWGGLAAISRSSLLWPAVFTALYTAAFAPYMHWVLLRLWRWTGLKPSVKVKIRREY